MKKFILFIFTIILYTNLFAQKEKDSIVKEKPNPVNIRLDEIYYSVKNIELTILTNKKLEEDVIKLKQDLRDAEGMKITLMNLKNDAQIKVQNLQTEKDSLIKVSKYYKSQNEKIVALLQDEHAGFNREILKVLEEINLVYGVTNYQVLENFKRISVDMDIIKNYIEKKPFDSLENKSHLKKLEELKQEATKYKFVNFSNDVEKYSDILSNYCYVTKKFANFFDDPSAKNEKIRNPKLAKLRQDYINYVFIISEIDKALVDVNYKYPYKATCTD
jgi:hypothetical protein